MSSGPCIDTLEELAGESAILDCRDPCPDSCLRLRTRHGTPRPQDRVEREKSGPTRSGLHPVAVAATKRLAYVAYATADQNV